MRERKRMIREFKRENDKIETRERRIIEKSKREEQNRIFKCVILIVILSETNDRHPRPYYKHRGIGQDRRMRVR